MAARLVRPLSFPGWARGPTRPAPAAPRRLLSSEAPRLQIWDSRQQRLQPFEPRPNPRLDPPFHGPKPDGFLRPWLAGLPAVSWYMCGPTVYDHSHIGHARTYVSFDIIRRIMSEIAQLNVVVAMGITDVDDKIIRRANEAGKPFHALAQEFELSFKEDMESLNVLPPSVYLRVSDRVQAIVDYAETLMERGYAYEPEESKGSIYFDTKAFEKSGKHKYGRLARSELDISEDQVPQEGVQASFKRHPADFALWKAAKPGEPYWDSPWGQGRPGWHIECSTNASGLFGSNLTIHSGGVDLQFPHHNNEVAQTEAFYDQPQWTQYWMHTGHLHIHGHKMSKSLKNFITIRDFLGSQSPNTFRMFCLTSGYRSNVDFTDDRIEECKQILANFQQFVGLVAFRGNVGKAELDWIPGDANWTEREISLQKLLIETDGAVRRACLEDFNTAKAISSLRGLVSEANAYVSSQPDVCVARGQFVLEQVVYLLERYFRVFGFPASALRPENSGGENMERSNALAQGWVDLRGRVRQLAIEAQKNLKAQQKSGEPLEPELLRGFTQELLQVCDSERDQAMPKAGVTLQDFPRGLYKWEFSEGKKPDTQESSPDTNTQEP